MGLLEGLRLEKIELVFASASGDNASTFCRDWYWRVMHSAVMFACR